MQLLMYPSIDLDSTFDVLATDTWRRGISYAREGRVLSCVWDPKLHSLFGGVRGNHGHTYTITVRLSPADTATWNVESGFCSCPVHLNCKHVAARNVMVYRLTAHDTIEDKVMAFNARKAKLFASVIDDGNAFGSALTADAIRGLLA